MNCDNVRELMPDLAAGRSAVAPETEKHLHACAECTGKLQEFRQTMALLDDWTVPGPSPYFDVRLMARLREEAHKQPVGWLHWLRRPALAVSLTMLVVLGSTWYGLRPSQVPLPTPGTAVGDLQALDKNQELYADFDVLDDLQVQQDVSANQ